MIKLKIGLFEGDGPLTQGFGEHPTWYAPFGMLGHNGIDYGIPVGRELYSCINGTVTEFALDTTGYGNYIKIENDECGVIYAHMRETTPLKLGQEVTAGQTIGYSGNTGNSTGPHLHFGVFSKPRDRENGYAGYIDPLDEPIVWVDNSEDPEEVSQCLIDLKLMEENKDDWKAKTKEERDRSKKLQESLEKAVTTIEKKQERIDRLESDLEDVRKELDLAGDYIIELEDLKLQLSDEIEAHMKNYEQLRSTSTDLILELKEELRECQIKLEDSLGKGTKWELIKAIFRWIK